MLQFPKLKACVLAVLTTFSVVAAESATIAPKDLAADQQRAAQRLDELESRLHALAGMLRDEEPENAGRLLLALQASRRDRLKDEMEQIRGLLQAARTKQASERTDALILRLSQLRELLTEPNIRFRLQLERLRGMQKTTESLKALQEAQQRERENAAKMAEKAAQEATENQRAAKRQDELASRTASMSAAMASQFSGSPQSRKAVQQAESAMRQATGKLGQQKPSEATPQQDKALDELRKAEQDLDEQISKLQKEMEPEVRAIVLETLKKMLADENSVIEATEAANHSDPVRARQRGVGDEAKKLSALVTDTAYSSALPVALEEITASSQFIAAALKITLKKQKALAENISSLIETIEKRPPPSPQQQQQQQQDQQQQQQQQQEQKLQKLLAELRMLHFLETKVLKDTQSTDADAAESESERLRTRQLQILEAVRKLQEELQEAGQ